MLKKTRVCVCIKLVIRMRLLEKKNCKENECLSQDEIMFNMSTQMSGLEL